MVIMKAYWKCLCDQGTATDFKKGCPIHDPALKVANYTDYAALQQRVKELEADYSELKKSYIGACETVAKMHEAALGKVTGPSVGVVEDVAALRAENERMTEEIVSLREALLRVLAYYEGCLAGIISDNYQDVLDQAHKAMEEVGICQ